MWNVVERNVWYWILYYLDTTSLINSTDRMCYHTATNDWHLYNVSRQYKTRLDLRSTVRDLYLINLLENIKYNNYLGSKYHKNILTVSKILNELNYAQKYEQQYSYQGSPPKQELIQLFLAGLTQSFSKETVTVIIALIGSCTWVQHRSKSMLNTCNSKGIYYSYVYDCTKYKKQYQIVWARC